MALRPFQILTLFAAALWLGGLHPAVAQSQTASAWQRQQHSAARLISAEAEKGREGTVWRAGVEITLDPGWKTYWRNPGDSGIPPRFNFSASTNVRDVKVAWPAPARFADGVGMSIGYADRVILPLRIRPR
ncbi:MAG: cytochrome C biogenesis protein, partial [Rhizobiales bacterium]|nr:cytochrome C biogenesis protein [Hyphomicrobiales bacterium]